MTNKSVTLDYWTYPSYDTWIMVNYVQAGQDLGLNIS